MKAFLGRLSADGIFVRQLDSAGFPLHTPFLECVKERLFERLRLVFSTTRSTKPNGSKWISTSQRGQDLSELANKQGDSEDVASFLASYFVDNLLKRVNFTSAVQGLSPASLVVEIAGRELFEKVLIKGERPLKYVPLLRGNARSAQGLLTNLGALYRQGFNPSIERLYPAVQWPVPRGTPSISSQLKWDHGEAFHVKRVPDYFFKPTASDLIIAIDPKLPEFSYLYDHIIDGRSLLPGAACLVFAWRRLAESRAIPWTQLAVQFESVQLKRAVFLDRAQVTTLKVRLLDPSGEFLIFEGANVVCSGIVKDLTPGRLIYQEILEKVDTLEAGMRPLEHKHLYADMHIRGYEYGAAFRHLMSYASDYEKHSVGQIRWTGQMVCFLDQMLHMIRPVMALKELLVPFVFTSVTIDPSIFFAAISQKTTDVTLPPDTVSQFLEDAQMNPDMYEKESQTGPEQGGTGPKQRGTGADILLPVYCSVSDEHIVAPGIEFGKVDCISLNRTVHPEPVVVDGHQFVGHHESGLLSEAGQGKVALECAQYEMLTRLECTRLLAQLALPEKPSLSSPIDEATEKTLRMHFEERPNSSLLKMVQDTLEKARLQASQLPDRSINLSQRLGESALRLGNSDFESLEPSLQRRILLGFVHSDLLASVTYTERLLRPLVDLVGENFAYAKKLTVLQMSPVLMVPLAVAIDNYLASGFVLQKSIDYTLVHPAVAQAGGGDLLPRHFLTQNWNSAEEPLWPESLPLSQAVQCAILYDDPLLQELQLSSAQFWEKLSQLLTPTGFVLILLRTKLTPVEQFLAECLFNQQMPTDEELQARQRLVAKVAKEAHFTLVASKSAISGQVALLFRQKQPTDGPFSTITLTENIPGWLDAVKEKMAEIENGSQETVWLLADGETFPGALGFFNCIRQEAESKQFRLFFLPDASQGQAKEAFSRHKEILFAASLAVNILKKNVWGTYRYLSSPVLTGTRLTREYHLNFGPAGAELANLALYDLTDHATLFTVPRQRQPLLQRKYAVYAAGINFRDLMFASGRLRPTWDMLQFNAFLGSEFAGRDAVTGERVFGIAQGCFASYTFAETALVRPIPPQWSYENAAGVPVIYFTVWYALIYKGRLQRGSTVLIHSAAGGVGQAALNVCKAYNCTIYATVGNAEKRQFLMEQFSIPPEHIFSSRDCRFEGDIYQLTDGRGVKYVLNSLIGEQLDASLRCVAKNGHFIELAKVETAMNKRLNTFPFLGNLSYHGVAIEGELFWPTGRNPVNDEFFDWLLSNAGPGQAVQPISTQVFPLEDTVRAFR